MSLIEMSALLQRVQENPDHYGKFVVVYNKRILAVGRESQALLKEAAEKAGVPQQELVTLIVHRPDLWEIPH